MANSLITIQLKLDALKIQVETPTVTSSGVPASGPSGAPSRAPKPSGGAPDFNLDEVRAQFNGLAGDLKAVTASLQGVKEVSLALAEAIATLRSGTDTSKTSGPKTSSSDPDLAAKTQASKARVAEINKQIAAESEAASASAKSTEAIKEETAAKQEGAQAAEEAAQATKESAEANVKTAGSHDAIIKAAARLQAKYLEGVDVTKSSAAAQEKLSQIAKARTQEELKLGSSASGRKSQIATLFESLLPVSLDTEFKAKAEKFNSAVSGLFVNFGPGVNKASAAVKELITELDTIRAESSKRIERDPKAVDPLAEARSLRGQQEQALARFREKPDSGQATIQFQEQQAALFASAFKARTANIVDAMSLLSKRIEEGAAEIELQSLEDIVHQSITALTDFSATVINASASPFITRAPKLPGGATGPDQDLTPLLTQNIIPKQAQRELTDFQRSLLTLAQTLIKTEEVTGVLPRIFRELAKDVGNFEANQRAVREGLATGGTAALGGPGRAEISKGVQAQLRTKIGPGGEFVSPTATDAATSFELLNANIQKLKLNVQDLEKGTKLDKVFSFTDAAGNVRKVQASVKQLGDTLGSVRVQAREVSKDLFSRVTVRAALSRVATWGAAAGIVFGAINAFKGAVRTIVETESSVIKLAKVMGESKEGFEEFTKKATEAGLAVAQKFGQPLEGVLETMINFGQQGLSFPEVEAGASASALASVVTTLNQPQAADALTAATEQFGLSLLDATSIVDKFNNVANNAAVTETVLTDALKRTGIAAVNAGVDLDQFNGIVAAIASQTRQSGNEVGTALRFIFSRINTQEAENGLAKVGIAVKDAGGNLRPFVSIITELQSKFGSLSKAQQTQAAISVAGTRRFNTFLALLQNFGTFQDSVSNSINSTGTSIEQAGIVSETASFKITQMKNAAAAAAISFGGVLSPALKVATDVATDFFNLISKLPTAVQALAVSLGAAGIAFAKFSQTFVALGDAATLPGGGVFGTLAGALTTGTSKAGLTQSTPGVAATIANVAGGGGEAIFAARSIGDFARAREGAESFTEAIKNSGRILVDINGKQVESTRNLTKFTAVTRGYKTVAKDAFGTATQAANTSNLGLLAMNTTIGRMSVALVGLSGKFLKTIPLIGTAINRLSDGLQDGGTAAGRFAGGLLKIGGAVGILLLAFEGFKLLRDFLVKDGDAVAKSLEPEIAKRQKIIRELAKQQTAVKNLSQAQRELARLQVEEVRRPEEVRREAIRTGDFKSPRLEQQRLDAAQREVDNQVGFATPQLIESVDKFGNVLLKTATSFDTLATAAGTANERLLALAQAKVAKAFNEDLEASDGFFKTLAHGVTESFDFLPFMDDAAEATISVGKKFNEASKALADFKGTRNGTKVADAIEEANKLGIPLREVNEDVAKELDRLTKNVEDAAGPITESYLKIIKAFDAAPSGQAVTLINSLGDSLEGLAKRQSQFSGIDTSVQDFASKFLITNSDAVQSIKQSIRFNAEDTKAALNEAGFIDQAIKVGDKTREALNKSFQEGDLVIVGDQQAIVKLNAFGDRIVEVFNDATDRVENIKLADLIDSSGVETVFKFVASGIREQIDRAVIEIDRVTTGAGRGILLSKEFNLGADRSFDLTSQQRVSQGDESLIRDLLDAEKALADRRDTFKAGIKEGDSLVTTQIVSEVLKLQQAVDDTSTLIKFRVQIEDVGKSFEKAIDDIEKNNIAEKILTQFSGVLGAERGAAARSFNNPLTRSQLSAEQRTNVDAPELVRFVNSITESEKAQGKVISEATLALREIDKIDQDFQAARSQGGITDPKALSQIAASALETAGSSEAVKLQEISAEQLKESITHTAQLERIAIAQEQGAENLAVALTDAVAQGAISAEESSRRTAGLSEVQLSDISTAQLTDLFKSQGASVSANVQKEVISRQVRANIGGLNLEAIGSKLGASAAQSTSAVMSRFFGADKERTTSSTALDPTIKALIEAVSKVSLSAGGPTGTEINEIRNILLETGGKVTKGLEKQLARPGGLEEINAGIQEFINSVTPAIEDALKPVDRPARSFAEDREATRQRALDIIAGQKQTAESELFKNTLKLSETFIGLVDATSSLEKAFDDNLSSAIQQIGSTRSLGATGALGAQAGATKGIETLALDIGKSVENLTARDTTEIEFPSLISAANAQKIALDALVNTFKESRAVVGSRTKERDEALARGDTGSATLLTAGIKNLVEQSALLSPKIEEGADALRRFGEVIARTDAINQFRLDIESLFKALEQEVDLTFDRTSIESGLGNTVFSLLRPTFEQFEQGQKGFATAFERAIADADFKQASGQLTPQEADRERSRATFNRDESVIKLAQEKENKSLQIQISAAEQIRKRLLEFAASGGAGAEQARGLFDQLTSDLESAGDVVQSSIGSRSIRNPLTGQEEQVPASQILEFKGLPSLEGLQAQVGQLAQQAKQEEASKSAALINVPIVDSLESLRTDVVKELINLKEVFQESAAVPASDVSAINSASLIAQEISKLRSVSNPSAQTQQAGRVLSSASALIDEKGLSSASKAFENVFVDGSTTIKEALEGIASNSDTSKEAVELVNKTLELFNEKASELPPTIESSVKGLESLNEAMSSVTDKFKSFFGGDASGVQRKANGGLIFGPGGPREDRVPILASPGEFVVNAAAVSKFGVGNLEKINGGAGSKGNRFAEGGFIFGQDEREASFSLTDEEERKRLERATIAERRTAEARKEAIAAGADPVEVARRGQLIRVEGPTGNNIFESTEAIRTITELSQQQYKVPSKADLIDEVAGLRVQEKQRVLNLAGDNKKRLRSAGFLSGDNYVEYKPDGTLSFSGSPNGRNIKVDKNLANVDISNAKNFNADIQDREARISRINKLSQGPTQESVQAKREAAIAAEEERVGKLDAAENAFLLNKQHVDRSLANPRYDREVAAALKDLAQIEQLASTAEGRQTLLSERDTVGEQLFSAQSTIENWTARLANARKTSFQFRHPLTNELVGEELSLILEEGTTVTPGQSINGFGIYRDTELLQQIKSGALKDRLEQVKGIIQSGKLLKENRSFGDFSLAADRIATSDFSTTSKAALGVGLGFLNQPSKIVSGVKDIGGATIEGLGNVIYDDEGERRSVKDNVVGAAKGIKNISTGVATGIVDTVKSPYDLVQAIRSGASDEDIVEKSQKVGGAAFDVLSFGATGGVSQIKNIPGALKKLPSTLKNAPTAAANKIVSSFKNVAVDSAQALSDAARKPTASFIEKYAARQAKLAAAKAEKAAIAAEKISDVASPATAITQGGIELPSELVESLNRTSSSSATSAAQPGQRIAGFRGRVPITAEVASDLKNKSIIDFIKEKFASRRERRSSNLVGGEIEAVQDLLLSPVTPSDSLAAGKSLNRQRASTSSPSDANIAKTLPLPPNSIARTIQIKPDLPSVIVDKTLSPRSATPGGVIPRGKEGIFGKSKAGLTDSQLIDNILGKGGFERLKEANVQIRPSTLKDLREGRDIEGITRDLRDESLKLNVSREEFIRERQVSTGIDAGKLSTERGKLQPRTAADEAALREQLEAAKELEALKQAVEDKPLEVLRKKPFEGKVIDERPTPAKVGPDPAILKEASDFLEGRFKSGIKDELKVLPDAQLRRMLDNKRIPANTALINAIRDKYKFANGGRIEGPGGPKSDSIPILASNGEFIVNAETVNRLGVPFFDSINKGQSFGGKFADGGIVGASSSNGSEIKVNVNTDDMAKSITQAISDALSSAEFPELQVNTEGVSVPVDFPSSGIPLDSSGLNLGDSLGSAVRNRLESVEGTVDGLREDSNKVLDMIEGVDFSVVGTLTNDVSGIKDRLDPIEGRLTSVEGKFATQKQEILTEVFTEINTQINNISIGNDINARLDRTDAANSSTFVEIGNNIARAIDTANRAMVQALARN